MICAETSLVSKTSNAERSLKERLPLIKCECGTEILLLPDLVAMDRAIDAHVAEHRKKGNNPSRAATSSPYQSAFSSINFKEGK